MFRHSWTINPFSSLLATMAVTSTGLPVASTPWKSSRIRRSAREYGIPCVVTTQVATHVIEDGATVDGAEGVVTIGA